MTPGSFSETLFSLTTEENIQSKPLILSDTISTVLQVILHLNFTDKSSNADTTQPLSQAVDFFVFFLNRQKQEGSDLLFLCCEQRPEGDNRHSGCPDRWVQPTKT